MGGEARNHEISLPILASNLNIFPREGGGYQMMQAEDELDERLRSVRLDQNHASVLGAALVIVVGSDGRHHAGSRCRKPLLVDFIL